MAYLQDFYHARTAEDKAAVVDKYVEEHLDMTTNVNINDDKQRKPEYQNSPHGKRYCESPNQEEDVQQLAEDACVINVINTACNQQRQTQMAQEHAEFILELKQNTENKSHTRASINKKGKNIYQQEGCLAFQNEESKIS
jgi:hypothetical protein